MSKIIAFLKFIGSGLITLGTLIGLVSSFDKTAKILVIIFVMFFLVVFIGTYLYYLIRTGIWNLRDRPYSINILLITGLLIHLLSSGFILYCSQHLFPSKQESKNLLVTTLPFFIIAVAIGIYDIIKFYRTWKARHLKSS